MGSEMCIRDRYYDSWIGGVGAALEQEHPNGSVRPISYIGRANLDSERHWTPRDFEAGSLVLATKRLRLYLCGTTFPIFRITKRSKSSAKCETTMRVSTVA